MLKEKSFFLISGPCSAESEEQILRTAEELVKNVPIDVFRAGLWKSRTSPTDFEGVGSKGLKWLLKVKYIFNLPVATEVILPSHAKKCIEVGIDYIWIGARTVVNPYIIKEITKEVQGKKVKVLVKNPICPDINLWSGAITRFENAGIEQIIAVHRGFYPFYLMQYRNNPLWEMTVELKKIKPHINIICDPSHIGGNVVFLKEIMQQAITFEMSGFMIESHYEPSLALSDNKQQIKPAELKELLQQIGYCN